MAKRICAALVAHVDAGKTTLSEALLYKCGNLRKLGRVDHKNAFLDTDVQERERGITIFSKQAILSLQNTELTLLDTPGHVDFSAEAERTLQVLDCAVLVVSGSEGVQGHTRTLWGLLKRYNIPVFVFVNKMDLAGADKQKVLLELSQKLGGGFIDFYADKSARDEAAAVCDESALEEFLGKGSLSDESIRTLIGNRKIFPCVFGSALKLCGIDELIEAIDKYSAPPSYSEEFGARVFKISRDAKNTRLSWMKITGGGLYAKSVISLEKNGAVTEEKADQLRIYSGDKFRTVESAEAGEIVAVTGLVNTFPGQGIGKESGINEAFLEPVLNYRLILPDGTDPHTVLPKLRQLEDEDPMLRIVWNERLSEIHVRIMGKVQLEVLERIILDRFGISAEFGTGSIVYKETVAEPVIGVGHFEPLRHYAEVHLLIEPAERGSGISVASACSTDRLEMNWQRLIFTHIFEKTHLGVLCGFPLTDVKITIAAGRAHIKHTEGGDFRQATYRAIRQGLMQAKSLLLEPFYDFRLELPPECVGRAMNDIQSMGGTAMPPETEGEMSVLSGYAPVAGLGDYWQEVAGYTKGLGRISCTLRGYEPCHNADEVIASIGYDAESDIENTADSVFCDHGAGFNVKWNKVKEYMHLDSGVSIGEEKKPPEQNNKTAGGTRKVYSGSIEQDKELLEIFERTYGKVEHRAFQPSPTPARQSIDDTFRGKKIKNGPEYILVDGYNIIFAWEELARLAKHDLDSSRAALTDILTNYRGFCGKEIILVFDAYRVKGNPGSVEKHNGIYIVYTKEAETADTYIERATYQLAKDKRVRVATSDNLEQVIILGHGAVGVSAESFRREVEDAQVEISRFISEHNSKNDLKWKQGSAENAKAFIKKQEQSEK